MFRTDEEECGCRCTSAELVASRQFADLIRLVGLLVDPAAFDVQMADLRRRLAVATESDAALVEKRKHLEDHERATITAIDEENLELSRRNGAAYVTEQQLAKRSSKHAALVKAWTASGESDEVRKGFRSPLVPAIEKARRAYGLNSPPEPVAQVDFPSPHIDHAARARPNARRGAARRGI